MEEKQSALMADVKVDKNDREITGYNEATPLICCTWPQMIIMQFGYAINVQ